MIQGSNKRIQKAILKAKKNWIGIQWEENRNNNKRAYQLVKILTSEKRCKSTGILGIWECLAEEQEILSRWAVSFFLALGQFYSKILKLIFISHNQIST